MVQVFRQAMWLAPSGGQRQGGRGRWGVRAVCTAGSTGHAEGGRDWDSKVCVGAAGRCACPCPSPSPPAPRRTQLHQSCVAAHCGGARSCTIAVLLPTVVAHAAPPELCRYPLWWRTPRTLIRVAARATAVHQDVLGGGGPRGRPHERRRDAQEQLLPAAKLRGWVGWGGRVVAWDEVRGVHVIRGGEGVHRAGCQAGSCGPDGQLGLLRQRQQAHRLAGELHRSVPHFARIGVQLVHDDIGQGKEAPARGGRARCANLPGVGWELGRAESVAWATAHARQRTPSHAAERARLACASVRRAPVHPTLKDADRKLGGVSPWYAPNTSYPRACVGVMWGGCMEHGVRAVHAVHLAPWAQH